MRFAVRAVFLAASFSVALGAQMAPVSQDAARPAEHPATTPLAAQPATPVADPPMIRVNGGDLLELKVFGVPEMSSEARIGSDGNISVALIGPVHVAGLTSTEAERLIEKRLVDGGMLRDPHVSVFVKEYATQGISVMGEVAKPGIYPLLGARRLFDALSSAGGTTARAGKVISITRRDDPEHPLLMTMDADPKKAAGANVEIRPGDTIVVSKAGVVYVVGDVARPGGYVMENNESLRVLQAVALAQGFNRTAALDSAKLIRKTAAGTTEEISVPLKKIMENKVQDIAMQGDDILFIPASAAKGALRRTMEAAIQAATGMAIYRPY